MPYFDLQGGLALSGARCLSVCGLLSVFGVLLFRVVVAPKAFAGMSTGEIQAAKRRLLILARSSALAGLIFEAWWLVAAAVNMAGADGPTAACRAVAVVVTSTVFGHVILAQASILAIAIAFLGRKDMEWRQRAGLCLATLALCLQAGHSHAYSMHGGLSLLLACDVLHLLGAGGWLGGLVPLLVMVWAGPPRAGATAARWFSPLGQGCIAALVVSASYQGWVLIATLPGLVGTAYGWMALAKLALLGVLLCFAAANRYRFAPALLGGDRVAARRMLARSILLQTGAALAIVAAASVLSELPPSMHDQPIWPFAQRFSLDAVAEDADFRREVLWAAGALGCAALFMAYAFIARRWRVVACLTGAAIGCFALPHLDLLLVPAYRTSFYRSPTGFSAPSIVQGQAVYTLHCVSCHGADGRGEHPAVANLPVPPADLTAAHLWMHSDGELFWWLSHGIATPEGALAMPGSAGVLDDDQLWAAIDFIRARNAGVSRRAGGTWAHTVQAPGFDASCGAGSLRGHFVRLRFGGLAAAPATAAAVTVLAGGAGMATPGGVCVVEDETVPLAYAIVSGLDAAQVAGSEFLIDQDGWLRAMQPAGVTPGWSDAAVLAAELRTLRQGQVAADAPMKMPM